MKIYDLCQQACVFQQPNDRFRNSYFTAKIFRIYIYDLFETHRCFSLPICVFLLPTICNTFRQVLQENKKTYKVGHVLKGLTLQRKMKQEQILHKSPFSLPTPLLPQDNYLQSFCVFYLKESSHYSKKENVQSYRYFMWVAFQVMG